MMPKPIEPANPDCPTCVKRAADYTELRAESKVVSLGRANCQECGERYTVLAEESTDE